MESSVKSKILPWLIFIAAFPTLFLMWKSYGNNKEIKENAIENCFQEELAMVKSNNPELYDYLIVNKLTDSNSMLKMDKYAGSVHPLLTEMGVMDSNLTHLEKTNPPPEPGVLMHLNENIHKCSVKAASATRLSN